MADDDDFRKREPLDGLQDFGNQRGRGCRQDVGLEAEMQGEMTRGGGQRGQRLAEDPLHLGAAHRRDGAGTGVRRDAGHRGPWSRQVHGAKGIGDVDASGRAGLRVRQQHDRRRRRRRGRRGRRQHNSFRSASRCEDQGDRCEERRWSRDHCWITARRGWLPSSRGRRRSRPAFPAGSRRARASPCGPTRTTQRPWRTSGPSRSPPRRA